MIFVWADMSDIGIAITFDSVESLEEFVEWVQARLKQVKKTNSKIRQFYDFREKYKYSKEPRNIKRNK